MINKPYIFLDIDGVLATTSQYNSRKTHIMFNCYPFDKKCVKVFNDVCDIINPIIILSSDWKHHYDIETMNEIFKWNCVNKRISAYTPTLWGETFKSLSQLEECRAHEILRYVLKNDIQKYIAIDDLNLSSWMPDNFVLCSRANEGIKQSGIKEKIIKKLK